MSEREPSQLSGTLIARKGRAWPGEIAADAVMREAAAARPRRRMAVAFGLGALVLAAGSGVLGYRAGIEQASRHGRAAAALAEATGAATRAGSAPPANVVAPGRMAHSPEALDEALEADEPGGLVAPAKPAGTFAPPLPPPGDLPLDAEAWVDLAAVLDSMAAPAPPPPPNPAVRAAGPAPAPREKPAVETGVRIQLSALRSAEAARREWQRLKRSHGALLDGRRPIVVRGQPAGADRPVYRLQLAAFESRAAARSFCRRARSRNLDCMIVVR